MEYAGSGEKRLEGFLYPETYFVPKLSLIHIYRGLKEWSAMKNAVRDELRTFIYEQTKRSPIILPIFLEV